MILPKNGRIVIIDDEMDNIKEFMEIFSMEGVSFSYFSGSYETLPDPDKPLTDTFLVLLDLELDGSSRGDDATQASQVINVLDKVLGPSAKDRSVIIVAWSKSLNILKELKPRMSLVNMSPLAFLEMDKLSCKKEDGHFDIELIKKTIEEKMAEIPSINLMYFWDNLAGQAAAKVYKSILSSSNVVTITDLNKRLNTYYEELAKAYVGKGVTQNHSYATINMLNVLLANEIGKSDSSSISLDISRDNRTILDLIDYAKINSSINLISQPKALSCGSVHINPDTELKVTGFDIFKKKDEAKQEFENEYNNMISIICEVSTLCDQAQDRRLLMRFCPGLLVPSVLDRHFKQYADYLYISCLLYDKNIFNGKPFYLVLDFRKFFTVKNFENQPNLLFQLNENLLMHLQNRLGRQISNPGLIFADHKNR
ncbi:hypothetical protein Ana3638_20850 [Anaerocolumna sedimenticola]|uniref:Uncharacterized protein n=1 Tax=Anaerocolumna sedimenticola TaxID=2696063 RepID=A0A6P1TU16_9FIRM|nr:hypothetical protein [Anaerocolumna sedimenticola]QHQ62925.1 hypothetical protein Ana3638_20850 [Anaerocolumna sedimenticola]